MILVDFNQVCISNILQQIRNEADMEEGLIRHMVLSSLLLYRKKFPDHGEMIICCDDQNYWRKEIFPYYKASRKKSREASTINWSMLFDILDKIRSELSEYLGLRVIKVDQCEADDIIAVLVQEKGEDWFVTKNSEKIVIISSDKDFVQLQRYGNVEQYAPIQKKMLREQNPARFLHMHIMKGDGGDGIPNFLSDDDVFLTEKRQKPIRTKKLNEWAEMSPEDFCDERMLEKYNRNKELIDLSTIPEEHKQKILESYEEAGITPPRDIFGYLMSKSLKNLTDRAQEFTKL